MATELTERREKKVEYVELIYDLIFVYIVGRNNSLLHHFSGGFIGPEQFFTYVFCTLAVIQIWNYTTYYINIYGRHSVRDHVFLFINMFLLYFLAEGTGTHWAQFHAQYHAAWALILLNTAAQYLLEGRNHPQSPEHRRRTQRMSLILLSQSVMIAAAIGEYRLWQTSFCSASAIVLSLLATSLSGRNSCAGVVDFAHLSERAMLYVVFTFGEMIIAIASYFDGELTANNLYFSAMAFLIVTGLFLSYGIFYDRILDRNRKTNGIVYMLLHIFLILTLNNLTTALEFMHTESVSLLPKLLFLLLSLLIYYGFLLLSAHAYSKPSCLITRRFLIPFSGGAAAFAALMLLWRQEMRLNIALTVLFVFSAALALFRMSRAVKAPADADSGIEAS